MQKLHYQQLAPCIFAIVIDALGFGLVYPVMTALLTTANSPMLSPDVSVHVRNFYLGLSFMLYPLCMFFGAAFMSDLSDNYGRKKVLLMCMAGISFSFIAMAVSVLISSIALLLFGRAFSGLMAGSQPIAQAAISDLSTLETKAKNMSMISLSYCFGTVLGPLLGGFTSDTALVSWFNFSTPFFIAGGLAFAAYLWLTLSFKETFFNPIKKPIYPARPIHIFIEAFQHKKIRLLAIVFLLMQMGFSIYFQFIIVHMEYSYAYSNWQLGAMQGMIGLGFALGLLLGMPKATDRWQVLSIAIVTGLLTGLGQLISASLPFANPQWILAIFIAACDIMVFTCMLTLFSNAADKSAQGWAMGIANAVMALSWSATGLCSNLLGILGTNGLIFIGGILLILGSLLLKKQENSNAGPRQV